MSMISTLLLPGVNLLSVTCGAGRLSYATNVSFLAVCAFHNVFGYCLHFSTDALPHLHNVTPVSLRLCGYDGKGSSNRHKCRRWMPGTKPGQLSSPLRHGRWPLGPTAVLTPRMPWRTLCAVRLE